MAILTEARVVLARDGREIPSDPHGNNVAIACPECETHPVLLTARPGWRGSRQDSPAQCRGCHAEVWMVSPIGGGIVVREVEIEFRPQDQ